jgi:hypothetical protein
MRGAVSPIDPRPQSCVSALAAMAAMAKAGDPP